MLQEDANENMGKKKEKPITLKKQISQDLTLARLHNGVCLRIPISPEWLYKGRRGNRVAVTIPDKLSTWITLVIYMQTARRRTHTSLSSVLRLLYNVIQTFIHPLNIPREFHPWGALVSYCQAPSVPERAAESDRGRVEGVEGGGGGWDRDGEEQRQPGKLRDVMHIHSSRFHLSCELKCRDVEGKEICTRSARGRRFFFSFLSLRLQWRSGKNERLTWRGVGCVEVVEEGGRGRENREGALEPDGRINS